MKTLSCALLLASAIGCSPGVYPMGGGIGLINLGNTNETTLEAWYQVPSHYQIDRVYRIVDALNSTGLRCPQPVSVGALRYELLRRCNDPGVKPGDIHPRLFESVMFILSDGGCGFQNDSGFTLLSAKYGTFESRRAAGTWAVQ